MSSQDKLERALRDALLEAARAYADATAGGAESGIQLAAGSMLRIRAKEWRRAEIGANDAHS